MEDPDSPYRWGVGGSASPVVGSRLRALCAFAARESAQ